MEVDFTPEVQAKLTLLATQRGRNPVDHVQDVPTRYLQVETRFLEAVENGIAASGRGELIEEEEMDARVAQMIE